MPRIEEIVSWPTVRIENGFTINVVDYLFKKRHWECNSFSHFVDMIFPRLPYHLSHEIYSPFSFPNFWGLWQIQRPNSLDLSIHFRVICQNFIVDSKLISMTLIPLFVYFSIFSIILKSYSLPGYYSAFYFLEMPNWLCF